MDKDQGRFNTQVSKEPYPFHLVTDARPVRVWRAGAEGIS